jgi:transcriptional regulator with XRE-family HTH domain
MDEQRDYGRRLKQARTAAGLTLRELAERLRLLRVEVDFTSLSHLEHGRFRPSYHLGRGLTDVLGVDLLPAGELARAHARIAELEAEVARLRGESERQATSLEERARRGGRDGMVALVELINRDEE